MIYYIQIDRLGHTISTQKLIVQSDHPCPRYKTKREGLVWRKPNRNVFAHISSYEGLFELSFFVLKPCALAGQFEYNKPYNFENFIFTLQRGQAQLQRALGGSFFNF